MSNNTKYYNQEITTPKLIANLSTKPTRYNCFKDKFYYQNAISRIFLQICNQLKLNWEKNAK